MKRPSGHPGGVHKGGGKDMGTLNTRQRSRQRRRRRRRRRERLFWISAVLLVPALLIAAALGVVRLIRGHGEDAGGKEEVLSEKYIAEPPEFSVELLDMNEYSRPGTALPEVRGIVIHYTANPGTTAEQNRSYFQNLKDTGETYASSHFIIGMAGEIIQCIPCAEIAYASNDRNADTVSIECCIPDETGRFTDETYQSLVHMTAWLMGRYQLSAEDVIRHYDVTGKSCPKFYVENEWAWNQFKEDLLTYIDTYGVDRTEENDVS